MIRIGLARDVMNVNGGLESTLCVGFLFTK